MIYYSETNRFNQDEEPDLTDQELKAIFEHDEFEDYLNSIPTAEERNR